MSITSEPRKVVSEAVHVFERNQRGLPLLVPLWLVANTIFDQS